MSASTNFIWLDPTKAEIRDRRGNGEYMQLRVKCDPMPGIRWMIPSSKGNGHFSRYTHGYNQATCYFLPSMAAWTAHQQRQ